MANNLSVPALCVAGVKSLDHPSLSKWRNPNTGALLLHSGRTQHLDFSLAFLSTFSWQLEAFPNYFTLGSIPDPENNKEDST